MNLTSNKEYLRRQYQMAAVCEQAGKHGLAIQYQINGDILAREIDEQSKVNVSIKKEATA